MMCKLLSISIWLHIVLVITRATGAPVKPGKQINDCPTVAPSALAKAESQCQTQSGLYRYESFPPYVEGRIEKYMPSTLSWDKPEQPIYSSMGKSGPSKQRVRQTWQHGNRNSPWPASNEGTSCYREVPNLQKKRQDDLSDVKAKWYSETDNEEGLSVYDTSGTEQSDCDDSPRSADGVGRKRVAGAVFSIQPWDKDGGYVISGRWTGGSNC